MNGSLLTPSPSPSPSQITANTINTIAYIYVLPVVCILGIVGNITNLIVLASRRLRAVSYMYLRALAVADLLCMIFVLCFVSLEMAESNYGDIVTSMKIYQIYRVHFMLTLINWAVGTGVYVVVALSLERFVSIVFPMHFRTWNSPTRATKAIAVAYILPAILYFPYGIWRYQGVTRFDTTTNTTKWTADDTKLYKTFEWNLYKWFRETCLRFAPIIFLCIINVKIMLAFRRRQKMFSKLTKRKEVSGSKDDTLIYMLGGTVIMFFICNIPAALNLLFIQEKLKKRVDYQIFRATANILEIANHASQFYVFCACSSDYRTTFLLKFPCFKKAYSRYSNSSSSGTLRNIVKRTQSMITREDRGTNSDEIIHTNSPKRHPTSGQVRIESDRMEVRLGDCDEIDQSDHDQECDILLRHNLITTATTNGESTFL